jgi:hypothetical protein
MIVNIVYYIIILGSVYVDRVRADNFKTRNANSFLKAKRVACLTVVKNSMGTGVETWWKTGKVCSAR